MIKSELWDICICLTTHDFDILGAVKEEDGTWNLTVKKNRKKRG